MTTSPVPGIIDAIIDALENSDDLEGVTIRSGPFDATGVREVIELNEIIFEDEQSTMGTANRQITFRVNGIIETLQFGAGEEVISAARTRAFALMDIVETVLVEGLSATGLAYAEISTGKYYGGVSDQGHIGHLEFTLRCIADLG